MGLLAMWELLHQVLHEYLQGQTTSLIPFWTGQNQIVLKMVSSPCEREKRSLTASVRLPNSRAAASFQHTQLLLLQSVTSLVNHPLFISKSYVKLCTIAFRPCTGKRRDRASERPGKTKAEKPLKSFAWEIVWCSYIQGREEKEIISYATKSCHLGTNSFDLSI